MPRASRKNDWETACALADAIRGYWANKGLHPKVTIEKGRATMPDGSNPSEDTWHVRSDMKNGLPTGAGRTVFRKIKIELRRRGME